MNRKKRRLLILEIFLIIFMLLWIYPFICIFFNSFKTIREMMTDFMAPPSSFDITNYIKAWNTLDFIHALRNSVIVTVLGVLGLVIFDSMAAYKLSRSKTRISNLFYIYLIFPMLVPFQTVMISATQVAKTLHLSGTLYGLAILYWGVSTPFCVFLYHGFVKGIPTDLDESAMLDGASQLRIFWQVIFPLLKPITATAVVINALFIWNDFLLPLVIISGAKTHRTIQMAIYTNFGSTGIKWNMALPAIVMAMIPSIIFFIIMQENVVKGVTVGAVKG